MTPSAQSSGSIRSQRTISHLGSISGGENAASSAESARVAEWSAGYMCMAGGVPSKGVRPSFMAGSETTLFGWSSRNARTLPPLLSASQSAAASECSVSGTQRVPSWTEGRRDFGLMA